MQLVYNDYFCLEVCKKNNKKKNADFYTHSNSCENPQCTFKKLYILAHQFVISYFYINDNVKELYKYHALNYNANEIYKFSKVQINRLSLFLIK